MATSESTSLPDNEQSRACNRCGVEKPLTQFKLRTTHKKHKTYTFYDGICRECYNKSKAARRRELTQINTPQIPLAKRCAGCDIEKPSSEFGRCKRERDGLQTYCKACRKAYTEVNKAREVARVIEWQRQNPERTREKQERYEQRDIEAHRARSLAAAHRRRARKTKAGGSYTPAQFKALCDAYGNVCLCCGAGVKLTADHVIPIAKGGSSDISNIQPLCLPCNSHKSTATTDYRVNYARREKE
jgi:5-methylcytosine-specific restriction endonuclease McrA